MGREEVAHHKEELRVWGESMKLAVDVYRATLAMPSDQRYGLTSQLRRAAAAVPANIAEGAGRGSSIDFSRFIAIARGCLSDFETHLLLAEELQLVRDCGHLHARIILLRTMLTRLYASLRRR